MGIFRKKKNATAGRLDPEKLPRHIAIIMDGNGRWAQKRGLPRTAGHAAGAETFRTIATYCRDIGIQYLSVYAFSTENWSRPQKEVDALMKLLRSYLKDCIKRTTKNNMRVRVIGDKTGLSEDIRNSIEELERVSAVNTGLNFTIAINYGSRDEMRRAMVRMAKDVEDGKVKSEEITEEVFKGYLDTWELPDPDLLIRTSGEQRLSNFLLWQLAYTEFVFMEVLWPDFNRNELIRAIRQYNGRERRFGGI